MARTHYNYIFYSAISLYVFLALTTEYIIPAPDKRDGNFNIQKLPLRPGDDLLVTEFLRRKARVREVCTLWGAYQTKGRFLKAIAKESGDKIKSDILKDRKALSQEQLERMWQLGKRTTFHQMFVDMDHGLTWCKVPKAASTSWLHVFLETAGVRNVSTKDMSGVHSLLREKYPMLTQSLLKRVMPSTLKFMVVRHPFERLLSAYRDKLEDYTRDLKDRGGYYHAIYGKKIIKAYRKSDGSPDNQRKEPTFREFIQYILDTDVEDFDEHWRPVFLLCSPCHVRYDVIAAVDTLNLDADFILYHRGLSNKVKVKWTHKTDQNQTTSDVARKYYSQLTSSEIQQLYYKYLLDFLMFEYELDPYLKLTEPPARRHRDEEYYIEEYDDGEYDEDEEYDEDGEYDGDEDQEYEEETEYEDNTENDATQYGDTELSDSQNRL